MSTNCNMTQQKNSKQESKRHLPRNFSLFRMSSLVSGGSVNLMSVECFRKIVSVMSKGKTSGKLIIKKFNKFVCQHINQYTFYRVPTTLNPVNLKTPSVPRGCVVSYSIRLPQILNSHNSTKKKTETKINSTRYL